MYARIPARMPDAVSPTCGLGKMAPGRLWLQDQKKIEKQLRRNVPYLADTEKFSYGFKIRCVMVSPQLSRPGSYQNMHMLLQTCV